MSTLTLVRHGQARAFSDSPDRLSPTGWEQARTLGRYWIEAGTRFDAAYHGTLRRQQESCEAVANEFRKASVPFPEPEIRPGLNEYATQDLLTRIAPRVAGRDPEFAPLWHDWQTNPDSAGRNRRFQLMFEAIATRWVSGRLGEPSLEPWDEFRARALSALLLIRKANIGGRRAVAFTSGGPIGVAVQTCLQSPPTAALELNWRVRNTSLTTFLFSGTRISLDGFNELPHLSRKPDLVTFR